MSINIADPSNLIKIHTVNEARNNLEKQLGNQSSEDKEKNIKDVVNFAQLIKFSESGVKYSGTDRINYLNKLDIEDKFKLLKDINQRITDQGLDVENKEYLLFALDEIIEEDKKFSEILNKAKTLLELNVKVNYENTFFQLKNDLNNVKRYTQTEISIVNLLLKEINNNNSRGIFEVAAVSTNLELNNELTEIIAKSKVFAENLKQGYDREANKFNIDEDIEIKERVNNFFGKNLVLVKMTFDEAFTTSGKDIGAIIDFIDTIISLDYNPAKILFDSMNYQSQKKVFKLLIDQFTDAKNSSEEQKKQLLTACINSVESLEQD